MADKKKTDGKIIAVNRKARHDYFVEETYECGISLVGTEVKSLRAGAVNLKDSYCSIKDGEIFVKNTRCFISTPISLTAQRNGGTPPKKRFLSPAVAPATAVPLSKGTRCTTG